MTGRAHDRSPAVAPGEFFFMGAALLVALALPMLLALTIDTRTIHDVTVWSKPLKFAASLALHLATLGLLVRLVAPDVRAGRAVALIAFLSVVMAFLELAYIAFQAARGRRSHWNFESFPEVVGYQLMGAGAVTLVLTAAWLGFILLRNPRAGLGRGLHLGAGWGLVLSGLLTFFVAGTMSIGIIQGPQHWVGAGGSDAGGLPLFGWSTTTGDLRVPHFFASHILQGLPLIGLFADRAVPRLSGLVVLLGGLIGIALVGLTFLQALSGQPFFAFGG